MSVYTDIAFRKSVASGYVRSVCQARNRSRSLSFGSIVHAVIPLWGFGTFNSGSGWGSGLAFDEVWPKVYNKLVEDWSDPYGAKTRTREWSYFHDMPLTDNTVITASSILSATKVSGGTGYSDGDIVSVSGGTGTAATIQVTLASGGSITIYSLLSNGYYSVLPGLSANAVTGGTGTGATFNLTATSGPNPGGSTSLTVTDDLVDVIYGTALGSGTYTAQLSGSILDPTVTGPFDPDDATYGWQAMTDMANDILDLITIPSIPSNDFSSIVAVPISTGAGYEILTGGDYTRRGPVLACANGMPVANVVDKSFNFGTGAYRYPPTIVSTPRDTSGGDTLSYPGQGGVMSSKSTWMINELIYRWGDGDYIAVPPTTTIPPTDPNYHLTVDLYAEPLSFNATTGFPEYGTIVDATFIGGIASSNPLPVGIVTFVPSDVADNVSSDFGVMGFESTDG